MAEQLRLIEDTRVEDGKIKVEITKSPEKNAGILVTDSGYYTRQWMETADGKVIEVGRGVWKSRLTSPEDLWMPDDEYRAHRKKAEGAFQSRRIAKQKKERALRGKARLF